MRIPRLAAALVLLAVSAPGASASDVEVISFAGFPPPTFGDPAFGPYAGKRELGQISDKYKEPLDDYLKDPGVGHPGLQTVRDNLEVVVRISLHQYGEAAELNGNRKFGRRLKALTLKSLKDSSVFELGAGSGIFMGQAVFHDQTKHRDVNADITGDFSDPHWHLSEIKLYPPPEKLQEPAVPIVTIPPEEAFSRAVRERLAAATKDGQVYTVWDDRLGRPWEPILPKIRTEELKEIGGGFYSAPVDFVDKEQRHSLRVEFIAHRNGETWNIQQTSLRSVDGAAR
jgi:hypothetical protein